MSRREAAEQQVLIHLQANPYELLELLDSDDLVAFLLDHFGDFRPDKQRGEAAESFLKKAIPDCFNHLVEQHLNAGPHNPGA